MDPKLRAKIQSVTAKRAKTVLDHILKHGKITTDELKQTYGYSHPPRAARDVREQGIPLKTTSTPGPDGRAMAVYAIDEAAFTDGEKTGRRAFSKAEKEALLERDGERCTLCGGLFPGRALQIDHRVPYEVVGEAASEDLADLMLVCGSCNRAKSWSCEKCPNWLDDKDPDTCRGCMWGSPERYAHIATVERRVVTINFDGAEIADFDTLAASAKAAGQRVDDHAKTVIKRALSRTK